MSSAGAIPNFVPMTIPLDSREIFYFLGIGGIGMSALARYFHRKGKIVIGYDRSPSALTSELEMEGITLHFEDSVLEIPTIVHTTPREKVLVIYTPAIPEDHRELRWFAENGYEIMKRSSVLGEITRHSTTIAVAGTHGKTTTSSLIAHLLTSEGIGCNAFLGGIATNYGSNLLTDPGSDITVVEADEFDRSFLTLSPQTAIITSMDPDHLDIYGNAEDVVESFQLFSRKILPGGTLLLRSGLPLDTLFQKERPDVRIFTYDIEKPADYYASSVKVANGAYTFSLHTPQGQLDNLSLGLPGRHNVLNAVAASAAALLNGLSPDLLTRGLRTFLGVTRRFQTIISNEKLVYIDDYAHHPAELTACIRSARELYPERKITGIFQPHLYTRTRDFADQFARSLEELDAIILLPIYPAREQPIPGVDSQLILDKISSSSKKLLEKGELLKELRSYQSGVILTMGAGDIDSLVEPIRQLLQ